MRSLFGFPLDFSSSFFMLFSRVIDAESHHAGHFVARKNHVENVEDAYKVPVRDAANLISQRGVASRKGATPSHPNDTHEGRS